MHQSSNMERGSARDLRIQDAYLNHCRRQKVAIVIHLLDQTCLDGHLIGFDSQSLVVSSNNTQVLVFKSAVISINPKTAFNYIFNDGPRKALKAYTEYAADFS